LPAKRIMRLFRLIDAKEPISYRTKVEIGTIPGHHGRIRTVGIHHEK